MNEALIDASSAILLFKAGLITKCCRAIHLFMTPAVYAEVVVPDQPGAAAMVLLTHREPGISVLANPAGEASHETAADLMGLHRGERDTLLHYLNGVARFVIIDDGKGVRFCRRYGIPHVNALLMPRLLFYSGHLSATPSRRFFTRIQGLGRYSGDVVNWAASCTKADLDYFLSDG